MSEPNGSNVQVIENATRDDVQEGDHIAWESTWECAGITFLERHEGIAHHRDKEGDWCAEGGMWITGGEGPGTTITIYRTILNG